MWDGMSSTMYTCMYRGWVHAEVEPGGGMCGWVGGGVQAEVDPSGGMCGVGVGCVKKGWVQ